MFQFNNCTFQERHFGSYQAFTVNLSILIFFSQTTAVTLAVEGLTSHSLLAMVHVLWFRSKTAEHRSAYRTQNNKIFTTFCSGPQRTQCYGHQTISNSFQLFFYLPHPMFFFYQELKTFVSVQSIALTPTQRKISKEYFIHTNNKDCSQHPSVAHSYWSTGMSSLKGCLAHYTYLIWKAKKQVGSWRMGRGFGLFTSQLNEHNE